MRTTKTLNKLSTEQKAKLKIDKLSKPVTFKLLSVKADPDTGQPLIPIYKKIPNRDTIILDGDSIDIGAVSNVQGDAVSFYDIGFWRNEGGFKRFDPRNAHQRSQMEFLLISNYNASNPLRDPNITPMFEEFRPEAKAKARVDAKLKRFEATAAAAAMTEEQCRELAASQGWDEFADLYIIKDKIISWCEDSPEDFLNANSSRERFIIATLKRAEAKNIIKQDKLSNGWVWVGSHQFLCRLPRQANMNLYKGFVQWYTEDDQAVKVFVELEGILYGRSAKSEAPKKKETPAATSRKPAGRPKKDESKDKE